MRSAFVRRALLLLVIVTCAMFVGSGLAAPTEVKPSAAPSPDLEMSPVMTGQAPDQAGIEKQKLEQLTAAAKQKSAQKAEQKQQVTDDKNAERLSVWTPELVCKLSLGIGFFAVFILVCVTILFRRHEEPAPPEQILRTFGILVIIFASVFLVIAGYSDTQITPVIGLLGTIAGYLLGRRVDPTPPAADKPRGSTSSHDTKTQQP